MDMFERKHIAPMLITQNQPPFDSMDFIFELKLDGIRCIAYLDQTGTVLRNKRNKHLNDLYPELSHIHGQARSRCILDGELVIINEGTPDFFELQRRSLMSNKFKISLSAKKLPVCFTAFDILYYENEQVTDRPLLERKELLLKTVSESPALAVSRYIETEGIALYNAAKYHELEGIVAKRKDSKYYPDTRTKDWIKCKALLDEDFIVCGYFYNNNLASIILGSYKGNTLIYRSNVAMGVSRHDFHIISEQQAVSKSFYYDFPEFEGAIWVLPVLVCTVKFMEYTPNGGLRQPVFKGLREDKSPKECVVL